jgi:2-keto-4-pentenoate hydratase/2-oxohepta-3-ene-1,7-dioic acid hydratase in catechol pathway
MRLVSYIAGGSPGFGLCDAHGVVALGPRLRTGAGAGAGDLRELLARDGLAAAARAAAGAAADFRLDEIELLPVIPNPAKVLCIGLNYEDHRVETARPKSEHPTVFTRFADTQVGHRGALVKPRHSEKLDYEGELAVVIGRGGRDIPAGEAHAHVAGYACYQDASVRDFQSHTTQFTPGKNFPATGGFGPFLVTPDEVGPIGPQRLQTRLNGTVMQEARLGEMIFPVGHLIAYISSWTVLAPGDVIVTGTPGGVGMKRKPPVYLGDGDEIAVEIDGVGTLVNRVVAETEPR